jgi:hypothetical protein
MGWKISFVMVLGIVQNFASGSPLFQENLSMHEGAEVWEVQQRCKECFATSRGDALCYPWEATRILAKIREQFAPLWAIDHAMRCAKNPLGIACNLVPRGFGML